MAGGAPAHLRVADQGMPGPARSAGAPASHGPAAWPAAFATWLTALSPRPRPTAWHAGALLVRGGSECGIAGGSGGRIPA